MGTCLEGEEVLEGADELEVRGGRDVVVAAHLREEALGQGDDAGLHVHAHVHHAFLDLRGDVDTSIKRT